MAERFADLPKVPEPGAPDGRTVPGERTPGRTGAFGLGPGERAGLTPRRDRSHTR
jgi:hypothetical protein